VSFKEKVASWPLKPNRTTAYACSIEVMKEPADSGYPILQDWSWKNFNSQQTWSLGTIFSYGKEYRDWTQQEKSHRTLKKGGFLHIWPFNLFAHLIKWNSTLCHAFFLKNRISLFTHLNHRPIKLCMMYSKWFFFIRNQSQRSRDHIKEKVASWPLKPNRRTAQVMKEPADSGYPILQEKCVAKCWISFN
jgi:hypothetical protein